MFSIVPSSRGLAVTPQCVPVHVVSDVLFGETTATDSTLDSYSLISFMHAAQHHSFVWPNKEGGVKCWGARARSGPPTVCCPYSHFLRDTLCQDVRQRFVLNLSTVATCWRSRHCKPARKPMAIATDRSSRLPQWSSRVSSRNFCTSAGDRSNIICTLKVLEYNLRLCTH